MPHRKWPLARAIAQQSSCMILNEPTNKSRYPIPDTDSLAYEIAQDRLFSFARAVEPCIIRAEKIGLRAFPSWLAIFFLKGSK